MDEETRLERPETIPGKTPGFAHFYVLLGLILLLIGGGIYMFVTLTKANQALRDELASTNSALEDSQQRQGKQLGNRLADLEVSLEETARRVQDLSTDMGKVKSDFAEFRTATDQRLADLDKGVAEVAGNLESRASDLASQIELVRSDFSKDTEQMKTTVAQIQDDSKYIVSELGKKAEKAYLRFMERKLKKRIGEVSEKVDTVKGDLEQQITTTRERIETVATEVGQKIEKKVEEHVKIDFVPSATDEE